MYVTKTKWPHTKILYWARLFGVAKTRVRVTPRVRVRVRVRVRGRVEGKGKGKGEGKGENCCGNSHLDFHPKFLPPPKLSSLYFIFH